MRRNFLCLNSAPEDWTGIRICFRLLECYPLGTGSQSPRNPCPLKSTSRNVVARGLRQMDRAFWCLHDHLPAFAILGLPTLIVSLVLAAIMAAVVRTWNFDPLTSYLVWAIVVPVLSLTTVTFFPLPCAVFAWFQAIGEPKPVAECFGWCARRAGRLFAVQAWLTFSYSWWFLLFGLPMLVLWARTCLAPSVALFEDRPRIFRRSRQLMREDSAIHVLAGLFFLFALVLGALIPLPRLIVFAKLYQADWTRSVEDSLWAFELICAVILLCGVAVSWSVSLALFYHDLRQFREGEGIARKVAVLQENYLRLQGHES